MRPQVLVKLLPGDERLKLLLVLGDQDLDLPQRVPRAEVSGHRTRQKKDAERGEDAGLEFRDRDYVPLFLPSRCLLIDQRPRVLRLTASLPMPPIHKSMGILS